MNNKQITTVNQNAKSALIKSKNLFDITKKILEKKELIKSFEFKPFLIEKVDIDFANFVYSVAISPDGKYIVSGSCDDTIKIWDIKTGECLKTLEGHSNCVGSVTISPDGNYIVSESSDDTIKIWDFKTAECLNTLEGLLDSVTSVTDGKYIVSGSWHATIKIWDFETAECLNTLVEGLDGSVNSVAISPDGKYIISGSDYDTIKIWDIKTGECLKTLVSGYLGSVRSVVISLDGKYIVSGDTNNRIKVWNIKTGECLNTLEGHSSYLNSVTISLDGKYIVSGSNDETIKIWNIKTGECLKTLEGHSLSVESVAISPDRKYIVSGSRDSTIKIWDFETAENIYTIDNTYNISIDNNGFFNANDENIDKYLRISEEPLTQRKLTLEEINHFRKKDGFLEIGEIIEKTDVEDIENLEWMQKFWNWADYYEIPENNFPRNKQDLINMKSLLLENLYAAIIPTEIQYLVKLEELYLHDFLELPDSITNLKNLKHLTLIWYYCENKGETNVDLINIWINKLKRNGCNVFIDCDYH